MAESACSIAIVTEAAYAGDRRAWFDDAGLAEALSRLGHRCSIVAWTNKDLDWQAYDAVYVSTTWNACDTPRAFLAWLKRTEADGRKRLINSREVLEDGFRKYRYLSVLEELCSEDPALKGFITPSRFLLDTECPDEGLESLQGRSLAQLLHPLDQDERWGSADIILKPCISADGKDTFVYERQARAFPTQERAPFVLGAAEAEETFQRLAADSERGGVIVQPYMRGVERGEYSLVFFEDRFSHAVRKPPGFKAGTGRRTAAKADELPEHTLAFASDILGRFRRFYGAETITRSRVDLFVQEGLPVLCELEVVEPNTNLGVVARDWGQARTETLFRSYAAAVSKRARGLSALYPT